MRGQMSAGMMCLMWLSPNEDAETAFDDVVYVWLPR